MDISEKPEEWSSFGVPSVIIKSLLEQNLHCPTAIQALSLPPAIFGRRDILGAAETGSGKTLAFGIPVLNGILELKKKEGKSVVSSSGKFLEINKDEATDSDSGDNDNDHHNDFMIKEKVNNLYKNDVGLVRVIDNVVFDDFKEDSKLKKPFYALMLTPTRELAIQIKNHLVKAAKYTDIKVHLFL